MCTHVYTPSINALPNPCYHKHAHKLRTNCVRLGLQLTMYGQDADTGQHLMTQYLMIHIYLVVSFWASSTALCLSKELYAMHRNSFLHTMLAFEAYQMSSHALDVAYQFFVVVYTHAHSVAATSATNHS